MLRYVPLNGILPRYSYQKPETPAFCFIDGDYDNRYITVTNTVKHFKYGL